MTQGPTTDAGEDPIVGDPDGVRIDDGEEFDYALTRPDGGTFGFDAVEIADLRELLEDMQGDG